MREEPITQKDVEDILELNKTFGLTYIAKQYGVTENAIRYHILKSGNKIINHPVSKLSEQLQQLKQDNEELKKIKNDFFNQAEISHEAVMNKNKIIEKLEKKLEKIKE